MNKQICIPDGAEQWLINLIELKNRTGISTKQIAESENLAIKSVSNVFEGKAKNPGVDLVRRIITALGGSHAEIFGESGAVIGGQTLAELQAEVDRLKSENELLTSSLTMLNIDIASKEKMIAALEGEIKILNLKLEYEEKLVAVHDFYNKYLGSN